MECIIKEIQTKFYNNFATRRILRLEGRPVPKPVKKVRYENLENGDRYLALSGGFCWPSAGPGFAIILAAQEVDDKIIFKVLAESQERSPQLLISGAHDLWKKYGYNCIENRFLWFGDPDSTHQTFITKFNQNRPRSRRNQDFFLAEAPHLKETDRFNYYASLIIQLAHNKIRRFKIDPSCINLLTGMEKIFPSDLNRRMITESPQINAVAFCLSALYEYKPWLLADEGVEETRDTIGDLSIIQDEDDPLAYFEPGGDYFDGEPLQPVEPRSTIPTLVEEM